MLCKPVMAEQDQVEIVVEVASGADAGRVAGWLQEHGLETLPLVAGVLAVGDGAAVRAAFGAEPHGELPVPAALRGEVRSISVVPPKRLHGGA